MFDFYPTCLEKTKHVGIFTPGCYFPHMFGFWHICMGKGTHVWKKPHNYMFANVCHFPHMCGKSHWHAYFPLSYRWYMLNAHKIWHILTSWNLAQQARRSMLAISGSVNISYLGFAKIYNSIKNWVINSCWLSQDNWTFVSLWLQLFNSSGKILNQLFWFK